MPLDSGKKNYWILIPIKSSLDSLLEHCLCSCHDGLLCIADTKLNIMSERMPVLRVSDHIPKLDNLAGQIRSCLLTTMIELLKKRKIEYFLYHANRDKLACSLVSHFWKNGCIAQPGGASRLSQASGYCPDFTCSKLAFVALTPF